MVDRVCRDAEHPLDDDGSGDAGAVADAQEQGGCSDAKEAWADNVPSADADKEARPWCFACDRAAKVCICKALPPGAPYTTETEIVVLVHPKETKRKCGTLPLLRVCLRNLRVIKGMSFPEPEDDPALHAELSMDGRQCALVSPGENAMTPEEFKASARGVEGSTARLSLILIDGTWSQAKGMVRNSRWLQTIPRVVIQPTDHSGYVFRQQPQDGFLSTLEAVAEVLEALEGEHGSSVKAGLRAFFAAMVGEQVRFIPQQDLVDKNAPGGREAFRKTVVEFKARAVEDRSALPAICICRWGDWLEPGTRRQMYVERILHGTTMPEAEELCRELSRTRKRGSRLFVTKLEKIADDAIHEGSAAGVAEE